jgi:hypothetical protein
MDGSSFPSVDAMSIALGMYTTEGHFQLTYVYLIR